MSYAIAYAIMYVMNVMLFMSMEIGFLLIFPLRWKHKWVPCIAYLVYFTLLYPLAYQGSPIHSLACIAGIFLSPVIFYKGKTGEKIFVASVLIAISILSDHIIEAIFYFIGIELTGVLDEHVIEAAIIIFPVCIAEEFLFVYLWNRFKKRQSLANINMMTFSVFPMTQILSFILITYFVWIIKFTPNKDINFIPFWAAVFLIMIMYVLSDILLFRAIYQNSQNSNLKEQIKMLEKKNEWEIEYNNMIIQKEREAAKIRHDFLNVIQILKLEADSPSGSERSEKVLKDLEEELGKTAPSKICDNPFINIIISERMKTAAERNIAFDTDIRLREYDSISSLDISRIFINLTDNALEAASKAQDNASGKHFIRMSGAEVNGYLIIRSENTYDGVINKQGSVIKTRKPKDIDHGLGLSIVKSIAEKYNGGLVIDYNGSVFTATVALRL